MATAKRHCCIDAEHMRQMAERTRALVVEEPPDSHERLLKIAADYDTKAREAERHHAEQAGRRKT
jgi:hypothetical protein